MADRGNTIRFITTNTRIPYAAPAIQRDWTSHGSQRAVTQNTIAAENAMTKCSTSPSAPVVHPFSNAFAPSKPLATLCHTCNGDTFRSANDVVAAIASSVPQSAPPQKIARSMSLMSSPDQPALTASAPNHPRARLPLEFFEKDLPKTAQLLVPCCAITLSARRKAPTRSDRGIGSSGAHLDLGAVLDTDVVPAAASGSLPATGCCLLQNKFLRQPRTNNLWNLDRLLVQILLRGEPSLWARGGTLAFPDA